MKKDKTIFDYSKLKGYMKEKEITQEKLSKKSNISITTINQNLKLGRPFRVENIIEIAKALNIAPTDISYYFFRIKV